MLDDEGDDVTVISYYRNLTIDKALLRPTYYCCLLNFGIMHKNNYAAPKPKYATSGFTFQKTWIINTDHTMKNLKNTNSENAKETSG